MKATIVDRRTELEKTTHCELVVGFDEGMTRWGQRCGTVGKGGRSLADGQADGLGSLLTRAADEIDRLRKEAGQ